MLRKFFNLPPVIAALPAPNLHTHYHAHLQRYQLKHDNAQFALLPRLQTLLNQVLETAHYQQQADIHRIRMSPPEKCQSLYLFGDVGRGKSMLMQLFYEACPIEQKRRVHFSSFMLDVHRFIHHWRVDQKDGDALNAFAKQIRQSTLLLCFDEFHITDIADAMLLGRLFEQLFERGVIVIITSNRHPTMLHKGGSNLLKDQFSGFIRTLQIHTDIVELNAKHDYRLQHSASEQAVYYFPLNATAHQAIQQHYAQLTDHAPQQPKTLPLLGRHITLHAVHEQIILSNFAELCQQPLCSADYLKIASQCRVLLLTDIPQLSADQRNEAKRFVLLVDVLYEHRIKLICSAAVPASELYLDGEGAFEFKRTVSRLMEMQSAAYSQT